MKIKEYNLNTCCRVIDTSSKFGSIRTGICKKIDEEFTEIVWSSGKKSKIKSNEPLKNNLFPDIFHPFTFTFQLNFSQLKGSIDYNWFDIKNKLYHSNRKRIPTTKFIKFLVDICEISEEDCRNVLKLLLARYDFKFIENKDQSFFQLGSKYIARENHIRYLTNIADEIKSLSKQVELVIQHNQTKGNYREYLLRKVLQKYLPKKYSIATGFIQGYKKQIDIIIYDNQNYSPLFIEDELVVVKSESVRAVIEVKTTLDYSTIKDALEGIQSISKDNYHPAPFFKGIFAFETLFTNTNQISNQIKKFYLNNPIENLYEQLTSVCVMDQHIVTTYHIDLHGGSKKVSPKIYDVTSVDEDINISTAMFIADIFPFLDAERNIKKVNISFFNSLQSIVDFEFKGYIHNYNWLPSKCFQNEHKLDESSSRKRIEDVYNWFQGNITIEQIDDIYNEEFYARRKLYDLDDS